MYRRRKCYLKLLLVVLCTWVIFFLSEKSITDRSFSLLNKSKIIHRLETPKRNTKLMITGVVTTILRYTTDLFLIEPTVLEKLANKSADNTAFHNLQLVTFGIIGRHNETWGPFCETLRSKGFSANLTTDILSKGAKHIQSVTTHILIHHSRYLYPIIHIVVFYRKQKRFLWHGQLVLPEYKLTFAQKEGIYQSFTTETHYLEGIKVLTPSPINSFMHGMKESEFIECNYSRAEKFYKQYPTDPTDEESIFFQNEGKLGLAGISVVFARLRIPFTLSFGSLLGWYRQCDILPYGDVDIEMFATDYTPTIIEALTNAGMALTNIYGRINDSYELSFVTPGNIRFDIFLVYEEEDSFWTASVYPDDGSRYKYLFPKYTKCWTTLRKILLRVPCDTEQYILAFYGTNWTIPLQSDFEMPNVFFNGNWPRDQWNEVMQSFD